MSKELLDYEKEVGYWEAQAEINELLIPRVIKNFEQISDLTSQSEKILMQLVDLKKEESEINIVIQNQKDVVGRIDLLEKSYQFRKENMETDNLTKSLSIKIKKLKLLTISSILLSFISLVIVILNFLLRG